MKNYVQTIDGKVLRGPVRVRRRASSLRGLGADYGDYQVDSGGNVIDNSLPYLQDSTPLWGATTPPFTPSGSSTDWTSVLNNISKGTLNILTARFAVPPPGTVITTPQGSIYRAQAGAAVNLPTSLSGLTTSGLLPWLLIGGVGLIVAMKVFGGRN